jgi:hypothetical protein
MSKLTHFNISWDEWTSKQNLNYMAVNLSGIPEDFSCMYDYLLSVSYFEYPHAQSDIRKKLMSVVAETLIPQMTVENLSDNEKDEIFCSRVVSLTYDGAPANEALSPSPRASGISAAEKAERRMVCDTYSTVEEGKCICHRTVNILAHVFGDSDEAGMLFSTRIKKIYTFFDLISGSQKNEQELNDLQKNDINRIGKIVKDVSVPVTRWNYNSRRLHRAFYLWKYCRTLESQTADTVAKKREWQEALSNCEESMLVIKYVLPVLARFHLWVVYFQGTLQPTISLILYMIDDLERIIDGQADVASRDADNETYDEDVKEASQEAEKIISKILAEFQAEFLHDRTYDYYHLAQMLDPRVSNRVGNAAELNRLINLCYENYCPQFNQNDIALDEDDNNSENNAFIEEPDQTLSEKAKEISAFKEAMLKCKVTFQKDGEKRVEFYKNADRRVDIDVLKFYSDHYKGFPCLAIGIRKIFGQPAASTSCERGLSFAGIVISARRTGLTPARAEKLVLTASRARIEKRIKNVSAKLPTLGILYESDLFIDDEEQLDQGEIRAIGDNNFIGRQADLEGWEAFFDE